MEQLKQLQAQLEKATAELGALHLQREEVDAQIEQATNTIKSLRAILSGAQLGAKLVADETQRLAAQAKTEPAPEAPKESQPE